MTPTRYATSTGRGRRERGHQISLCTSLSRRRVEQLYAYYRVHGQIPSFSRPRRRGSPVTDQEQTAILDAYSRYRVGAVCLERRIESTY